MTEREALLAAILKQPEDRTARLVYADWLDEHPELPAATATAEFIRLACAATKQNARMPLKAYAWLKENWKRLIPSVVALSVPITEPSDRWPVVPEGGMMGTVKGQHLDTYVTLPGKLTNSAGWSRTKLYSCRLQIWFERGLACNREMHSPFGRERAYPALQADRPELFVEVPVGGTFSTPPPDRGGGIGQILRATMRVIGSLEAERIERAMR